MTNQNTVQKFWELKKSIDRKSKPANKVRAQEELMRFASKITDFSEFGKYADYVKSWANAELVTNDFGRKLYVKLNG